jgi:hypothetical protein
MTQTYSNPVKCSQIASNRVKRKGKVPLKKVALVSSTTAGKVMLEALFFSVK